MDQQLANEAITLTETAVADSLDTLERNEAYLRMVAKQLAEQYGHSAVGAMFRRVSDEHLVEPDAPAPAQSLPQSDLS